MSRASRQYRGRFAPSPTGPLHFGSLVAAVGSYLRARASDGVWLVRIEDIDPPREQPGAATDILNTLERLGLEWDDKVLYQSEQLGLYHETLEQLTTQGLCYPCSCSRREVRQQNKTRGTCKAMPYPGTCRNGPLRPERPLATRVRVPAGDIRFSDKLQGLIEQTLQHETGDFVLRRSDGLFAYQLAVVVDDHEQGITEVVRGCDLLESTPRQLFLQQILDYEQPEYLHLPIAVNQSGDKLSKQTGARAIDHNKVDLLLSEALGFLGARPPSDLSGAPPRELLDWGVRNWNPDNLQGQRSIFWQEPEILAAAQ
ncbi:MAG: tRNA glutamyl-Q(34) synthetase GluQRS [Gammaproteobacteria bacterium]